jgi:hypothetical protein
LTNGNSLVIGGTMKIKIRHLLIIILIFFFVFAESKENQKPKWKGKIAKEKGIKVVNNPKEPLYGELKYELEEDLSIGKENDDHYMFYRILDLKIDEDENIYVLEFGNKRIQKFDRFGKYLCTIGRQGQGPGEYQRPFLMILDDKNGIVGVQDQLTLKLFNKDGNYLNRDIVFAASNNQLVVDPNGNFWGVGFESENLNTGKSNFFRVLIKYNPQGKIEKKVARFSYEIFSETIGNIAVSVVSGEEYTLFISPLGDQNLIYGYSKEYEIDLIDFDGSPLLRIRKEEPYQKFTPEEMRKAGKAILPEHKPCFHSIFTDSQGRIYSQRNNVGRDEKVERKFDIFSRDGYYIYKTSFSMIPFVIRNGFFYTQFINEDTGEVFVKRLRIKNWDQIKDGI